MTAPPQPRISIFSSNAFWIPAVAVLTLAAYFPAMRAGWVWDDNHYVTGNVFLKTLYGLTRLWLRPGAVPQYYPVTHTSFWIEYHLWGLWPLGYHLDNVLLHIANAVLIGLILRRLNVPGFALAAALFALHPVQVESVAWVTERKNVLSGLFYLLALWQALKIWRIAPTATRRYAYPLCLVLFILALLSKSVTSSLPAVILLLMWWKRARINWRDVALLIPFFLFGAVMGTLTSWMEKHVVGATGPEWDWSVAQRILIAGRAVWFYLAKDFWPHPLSFVYHRWTIETADAFQWLFPIALVAAFLVLLKWNRSVACAGIFFVVTLFPALGFVNVYPMRYSFVADHFQYLAAIAPISVAAALIRRQYWLNLPLLAILAFLTFQQAGVYQNAESLWRDVVAKDDDSFLGHYQLGMVLLDRGDAAGAESQFQQCSSIDPTLADGWLGLAAVAESRGDLPQARQYLTDAEIAEPSNPLSIYELGVVDRRRGHLDLAEREMGVAAKNLPDPSPAFEQIGEIEMSKPNLPVAQEAFDQALESNPDRIDTHNNLAALLIAQQRLDDAEDQCNQALRLDPDDALACNDMGIINARRGNRDEAVEYFQRALRADPSLAQAKENLNRIQNGQ